MLGAYVYNLRPFTVALALFFGVLGYLMIKAKLPRAPLILGIVLAPIMEQALRQSLIMSRESLSIFVDRPIALVLLITVVLSLLPFCGPAIRLPPAGGRGQFLTPRVLPLRDLAGAGLLPPRRHRGGRAGAERDTSTV